MRIPFAVLIGLATVGGMLSASAAEACTIHPKVGTTDAELAGLAKISRPEAERIAVGKVKRYAAVSVVSAELEIEHGCLLWSFDLRLAGASGIREVKIDAGDGRVLSVKRENSQQEAAEAKAEAKAPAVR